MFLIILGGRYQRGQIILATQLFGTRTSAIEEISIIFILEVKENVLIKKKKKDVWVKEKLHDNARKKIVLLGAILPFMETFNLLFLPFAIIVFIK